MKTLHSYVCQHCDTSFKSKYKNKKFCSQICYSKYPKSNLTSLKKSNSLKKYYSENEVWNKGKTKDNNNSLKKMSESMKVSEKHKKSITSDDYRKKQSLLSSGENNGFYGRKHTKLSRKKMSEKRASDISTGIFDITTRYGIKGVYYSNKNKTDFRYDSFWELLRMKILDMDEAVLSWNKKHGIKIPYKYKGAIKHYVPDFLIEYSNGIMVLEELKGYEKKDKKNLKFKSLKKYCKYNSLFTSIVEYKEMNELCIEFFDKSINVLRKEFKEQNGL